jgi:DNA polymerase (family 10)
MTKQVTNQELAEIFERIASLLEIKGEVIFKIRAYQRAAESLRNLAEEAQTLAAEKRLTDVPGIGKAISEKIDEIINTGKLGFLEKLEAEIPVSLLELLQVPDVGPKKVALFWQQAGVTNLAELKAAAQAGKLRNLPGMGEKSETRILAGLEAFSQRSDRMTLGKAWRKAEEWLDWLRQQPETQRAEAGGSLRRMRDTVGDLDIVIASENPVALMERFTQHPEVKRVRGEGENKSSVELKDGLNIQIWIQSPARFGSLWQYATGSKLHNVRVRELAQKKKLSLSERGMQDDKGNLLEYATEEQVYAQLGLAWIPPELREDREEVEAALKGRLPQLIQVSDLKSNLHTHTTWSDGTLSIEDMAHQAMKRGLAVLAITDHSRSLGIARGLQIPELHVQRAELRAVQAQLGSQITLLHGSEVDILADGSLDYPDEELAQFDIVIASLHSSLRQPREAITERLLQAIRNPHVDIIAHPSGRLLPNRQGADLDWEVVLAAARESGVALEINADPERLDLNDVYARRAAELGIPLTINTDAHTAEALDQARFGIAVARRAWVTPEQVINTWDKERLMEWLKTRGKNM